MSYEPPNRFERFSSWVYIALFVICIAAILLAAASSYFNLGI